MRAELRRAPGKDELGGIAPDSLPPIWSKACLSTVGGSSTLKRGERSVTGVLAPNDRDAAVRAAGR